MLLIRVIKVALASVIFCHSAFAADDLSKLNKNEWLVSSESNGLAVIDKNSKVISTFKGSFEIADSRSLSKNKQLISVLNKDKNSLDLFIYENKTLTLIDQQLERETAIDGVCLHKDKVDKAIYAFIIKSDSAVEQRIIYNLEKKSPANISVRELPISQGISGCSVNDQQREVFIAEELVGVWSFNTDPESEPERKAVALKKPFGKLEHDIASIQSLDDGSLLITQPESSKIALVKRPFVNQLTWLSLPIDGTEIFTGHWQKSGLTVSYVNNDKFMQSEFKQKSANQTIQERFAAVKPSHESKPVEKFGDAADDPAIWVNPMDSSQSLVLATDKQMGLAVYDKKGAQRQFIASGRVNNVDVKNNTDLVEGAVAIATASNRDLNAISIYSINESGYVSELPPIKTTLDEVYGLCMGKDAHQNLYTLINDKDGRYQQYLLESNEGTVQGKLVKEFKMHDQPEGCVVNDQTGEVFVGVEDHGIWITNLNPTNKTAPTQIASINEKVKDDVEGLALYLGETQQYLVVSSQGNDSYALFSAHAPYHYVSSFTVGANIDKGIDGASETDGLDVTSANLGGEFSEGLLVVQDGRNVMPLSPQNFKFVPFSEILSTLESIN